MWAHPKHLNKSILIKKKKQKQPKAERDLFFFYAISHMFAIHLLT